MKNESEDQNENIPPKHEETPLNIVTDNLNSGVKKLGSGLLMSIALLSTLAGGLAGITGALIIQKNTKSSVNNSNSVVSQHSDVVDVVHNASPAVVSIIISKDLAQMQQQQDPFNSPFLFDPFFQNKSQNSNSAPQYQQTGAGSGFFVSADGMILTNKHVVEDREAKYTVLTQDGKRYDAKILSVDPVNDLALVKINIKNHQTLNFADSSNIQIGEMVIAIGNSLGQYNNTVTTGVVSGIGRNITAGGAGVSEQLEGVIQTDAAINPGNSGGPLLNASGEVIGINTAIDQQGQLVGFAIPANDAKKSIASYTRYGKITKPFLGIRYVLITPELKDQKNLPVDHGALVVSGTVSNGTRSPAVVAGSAAANAGIVEGDIIVSINGQQIDTNNTLAGIIKKYNPSDKITMTVIRDKKTISVDTILGESK
ncbi:MAG: hypothetical protein NVSMB66_0660 [Candidatus Doudnabacteria bacterium]